MTRGGAYWKLALLCSAVAVAQRETLGFNARLAVGSHPGIALICDGIFDGTEIQGVVKTP